MSAFSKLLTGFSSLMLIGAIAAVPACSSDDDDNDGEGGAAGESGSSGKGGKGGASGAGGKGGASGSAGKGGKGGTGGNAGDTGEAGDTGTAGTPDQGGAGGEPASSGGSAGSSAGEGGSGGSGEPQIATAKFCNNVQAGEDDVTFTIRIGTGSDRVTLEAVSGTCAPIDEACPEVVMGAAVPIEILDDAGDVYTEGTLEILPGEQLVLVAEFDADAEEGEQQTLEAFVLDDGEACSEFAFGDL
jgi:hypothetical protein